jgi:hypothetical protein
VPNNTPNNTELCFAALDPKSGTAVRQLRVALPTDDACPQQPRPALDNSGFFFVSTHSGWRNVCFMGVDEIQPHHPSQKQLFQSFPATDHQTSSLPSASDLSGSPPPVPPQIAVAIQEVHKVSRHCAGSDATRVGRWDYDVGLVVWRSAQPLCENSHPSQHQSVVLVEQALLRSDAHGGGGNLLGERAAPESAADRIVVLVSSIPLSAGKVAASQKQEPPRSWLEHDVGAHLATSSVPLPRLVDSVRCVATPPPPTGHTAHLATHFFLVGREGPQSECAVFEVFGSEGVASPRSLVFTCQKISKEEEAKPGIFPGFDP